MTEHQIHILTRIFLAFIFIVGMIALFAFLSSRRAKKAAGTKKKDQGEFYNFDEVRRRENNRNRRRGKSGKNKRSR